MTSDARRASPTRRCDMCIAWNLRALRSRVGLECPRGRRACDCLQRHHMCGAMRASALAALRAATAGRRAHDAEAVIAAMRVVSVRPDYRLKWWDDGVGFLCHPKISGGMANKRWWDWHALPASRRSLLGNVVWHLSLVAFHMWLGGTIYHRCI